MATAPLVGSNLEIGSFEPNLEDLLLDPIKFTKLCWPDIKLYDRQVEILYSVRDNDETIVPAGNDLGKDFVAGLAALWFFCSRTPARVVTSSVDGSQLEGVLWGEIRRFIQNTHYPLPIKVNHLHIRQEFNGQIEPRSELVGRVVRKGEGLLGRHIEIKADGRPRCLVIFDEASAIEDLSYNTSDTWAHRKLVIGNPYPCETFFKRFVRDGDVIDPNNPDRYYRKIIRIRGQDSPNVRRAQALLQANPAIDRNELLQKSAIIPGVLDYDLYEKRRATWDRVRQCIGLDAEFYEGAEVLLYPPEWLNRAEHVYEKLAQSRPKRIARTMGVDSAEGGDNTVWTIIDELGILEQLSMKTPDTSVVKGRTLFFMKKYGLDVNDILFDRGGGGKQHADYLRQSGYDVRTVAFGERPTSAVDAQRQPGLTYSNKRRLEEKEEAYSYKNRRAEMYGLLRYNLLDPVRNPIGFGISPEHTELRRQLGVLPLLYDEEGRMYLPPKNKKNRESKTLTLTEMLGCSPDEADSLVLAVLGLYNKGPKKKIGAMF